MILKIKAVLTGVANAGYGDPDQDLVRPGLGDLDLLQLSGLAELDDAQRLHRLWQLLPFVLWLLLAFLRLALRPVVLPAFFCLALHPVLLLGLQLMNVLLIALIGTFEKLLLVSCSWLFRPFHLGRLAQRRVVLFKYL